MKARLTEQKRYSEAWETGTYIPMIGLSYIRLLYKEGYFDGFKTLLDVGCGTGMAVRYHREIGGINAYGIDFAKPAMGMWKEICADNYCSVASAEAIPFRDETFDMVTCTDVMEHIPEENVSQALKEIYRVGKNRFFMTIALNPAEKKMPDGSEPHICLKKPEWWIEKMGRIGYRFWREPYVTNILVINARKGSNLVLPNASEYRRYKPLQ